MGSLFPFTEAFTDLFFLCPDMSETYRVFS